MKLNNKRNKTNYSNQKGITLIALVITIVVLLILAGVSINAIFSENGIINKAKDAQNKMNEAQNSDLSGIGALDDLIYEATGQNKPVTNPYADQQWAMAYVCNNGTWSDTPLVSANGDTIPEGTQIVAKFYATGEKITPPSIKVDSSTTIPFSEGDAYKLVIEGTGEMGILMDGTDLENIKSANGWQTQTVSYLAWLQGGMQGDAVSCITPYIIEATICDGITNVGNFAFTGATSLSKVTLSSTVKKLEIYSFAFNSSLAEIKIPNSITDIKAATFLRAGINKIVIPNSVKKIRGMTDDDSNISPFASCENLKTVIIDKGVEEVENLAFIGCTNITKIVIGAAKISSAAFTEKENLKELIILDGIIETGTFRSCKNLTNVTISKGVTTIGTQAFQDCTRLTNVTIQDSVTTIGEGAFDKDEGETLNIKVSNEAMAKIVNGSYNGDTAKVIIANENSIAQNTINAKEVANHPVIYCGKEVKGYTCDNSAGVSKWKIYHSDGKNIYLIADNYITGEYIPSKDGETMTASTAYTNSYYFNNTLLNKYTGASSITDTNITPWLSYLKSSYGANNTNKNMQATAYLLDTEIWKGFKNTTKAKYAIGAPTSDMFVASYNTRCARQIELISQETGYKIGFKDEDTYYNSLDTYDYLLAHKCEDGKACYMWLASPSAINSYGLMFVFYNGGVYYSNCYDSFLGVRPLVCLESEVLLEKQEINGEIVYNIK